MVGRSASDAGSDASAAADRRSRATAIGSVRWAVRKTPLTTNCWPFKPSSRRSADVRSASAMADASGRVTSTMVHRAESPRTATASA